MISYGHGHPDTDASLTDPMSRTAAPRQTAGGLVIGAKWHSSRWTYHRSVVLPNAASEGIYPTVAHLDNSCLRISGVCASNYGTNILSSFPMVMHGQGREDVIQLPLRSGRAAR
ncbi:uncharacterized protein H6S33_006160 [Morchella sextelata]|jgi:hypothetical protein|uniref:uncharacterized protein n=1 Tax=Morchella sextelata TaxID=1174677 RepID=UPI001D057171|nr:uncharacterized protein H6S33_006160 [Morchella sextelata]KAH0614274.1 hypothetical protein H6S33_006160 [Morchella sextelata]